MIDRDPLPGHDPYPRDRLELLPLLDARQELLEEIVSDTRTTSRLLVPFGIAAALAIVAGAVWFAVAGGDDGGDDPVVAASSEQTAEASDPTGSVDPSGSAAQTATEEPEDDAPAAFVPWRELEAGDVLARPQCRTLRSGDVSIRGVAHEVVLVRLVPDAERGQRPGTRTVYLVRPGRLIAIDDTCTVVDVRRGEVRELRVRPPKPPRRG